MRQVNIRLTDDEYNRLVYWSTAQHRSVTGLARHYVLAGIDRDLPVSAAADTPDEEDWDL